MANTLRQDLADIAIALKANNNGTLPPQVRFMLTAHEHAELCSDLSEGMRSAYDHERKTRSHFMDVPVLVEGLIEEHARREVLMLKPDAERWRRAKKVFQDLQDY